ncbi:MAG: zinc ribbon domain-containing protein [Acidimicrobiales bacterium]
MVGPDDSESMGALRLLLQVQQRDVLLDQLAYRRRSLEDRKTIADLESRIRALQSRSRESQAQRAELSGRQDQIEAQIAGINSRIAAIEARLRQGGAYREVQAMSAEADSLSHRRSDLEDQELEIMEQLDPVQEQLEAIESELAVLDGSRGAAIEALQEAERVLDSELAEVAATRRDLAAGLPSDLAATYERLRERLGGIGAAKLVDGACSGCHLQLPTSERDRIVHLAADQVSFCEQCGRILVA